LSVLSQHIGIFRQDSAMMALPDLSYFTFRLGSCTCVCVSADEIKVTADGDNVELPDSFGLTFGNPEPKARLTSDISPRSNVSGMCTRKSTRFDSGSSNSFSVAARKQKSARTESGDVEEGDDESAADKERELNRLLTFEAKFASQPDQLADPAKLPRLLSKLSSSAKQPEVTKTLLSTSKRMRFREMVPNFSGRWMLHHIDGDMNTFLTDIGTSWMLRKMAKGLNYGIGRSLQDIKVMGGRVTITSEGAVKATTMTLNIGGDEEETIGLDGEPIVVSADWVGSVLRMETRKKDGTLAPATNRYLEGKDMVVENRTSSGLTVKRYFKLQH